MLVPFADGHTLLEFQLERLKRVFPDSQVVVATSANVADDPIAGLAEKTGVSSFRGDEQDVLRRFVDCCAYFGFRGHVIRICGDNPLLQTELLKTLVVKAAAEGAAYDYIGFSVDGIPAIRTHFGFFAESIAVDTLIYVSETENAPVYHEHVTNYIYENGERFRLRWLQINELTPYLSSLRLTVDSRTDLENVSYVYEHLRQTAGQHGPGWEEIVSLVEREPGIRTSMEEQIRLYQK